MVNPDCTYTYTPTKALALAGGSDSFTVAVNDGAGEQLPGIVGLVQASSTRAPS